MIMLPLVEKKENISAGESNNNNNNKNNDGDPFTFFNSMNK